MLIYDQSKDPYHSAVRALGISEALGADALEVPKLTILDLAVTFPALLRHFRLPRDLQDLKKLDLARPSVFRPAPASHAAVEAIRAIQAVALATLASGQVIRADSLRRGLFARTDREIPDALREAVASWVARDADQKQAIILGLSRIPLNGPDGLKHRTGLMEHRYDAA